jgi:hypothetical protein
LIFSGVEIFVSNKGSTGFCHGIRKWWRGKDLKNPITAGEFN